MREVVLPAKKKRKAPPSPPAANATPPAEVPVVILPEPAPSTGPVKRSRHPAPRRERDFIIRYGGRFIGHFRAGRPVTPRAAQSLVIRELRAGIPDFDPALLALYRPVKIRLGGRPGAAGDPSAGEFFLFAR